MKQLKSWREIKDWAEKNGYKHMAERMQLNNDCWLSSGEFGRDQVYICDAIRHADSEEERHKIAKAYDEAVTENYGLY